MSSASPRSFTRRQPSPDGASWALVTRIGVYLREQREKDDLTQVDFAIKHGFSLMTLRRLEGGERLPTLDTLMLAAKACSISVAQLLEYAELASLDRKAA